MRSQQVNSKLLMYDDYTDQDILAKNQRE